MKLSVCLVLAVASVVVIFAKESEGSSLIDKITSFVNEGLDVIEDIFNVCRNEEEETIAVIKRSSQKNLDDGVFVEAVLTLRDAYIEGTEYLPKAEKVFKTGIANAKKIVKADPEAAIRLLQQAFAKMRELIFKCGISFFLSYGKALNLSTNGTRQGMENASHMIQDAGFSILDSMSAAENFYIQALHAEANESAVVFKTVVSTTLSGFSASYQLIQESIKEVNRILRDAQQKPIQIENYRECPASTEDPEGAKAVKHINETANKALKRGANPSLVENLRQILICYISDIVNITSKDRKTFKDMSTVAGVEPLFGVITFFKQTISIKTRIQDLTAAIYVLFGDIVYKSTNPVTDKIESAITHIENGIVQFIFGVETATDIVVTGLKHKGKALTKAIQGASEAEYYGKLAFMGHLLDGSDIVFDLL